CMDVFFFSSGRRHTRFSRDWSSDVCSSAAFSHMVSNGRSAHCPVKSVTGRGTTSLLLERALSSEERRARFERETRPATFGHDAALDSRGQSLREMVRGVSIAVLGGVAAERSAPGGSWLP